MIELTIQLGDDEVTLNEENTTVFTFREAKYMDHVFIAREAEEVCTYLFGVPDFVKKLIDMDFPLSTARWPREGDFVAYEGYIDSIADAFHHEIEEL
jgi:hypothetical protein